MERAEAFVSLVRPRHTAQIVGIVAIVSIASHGLTTTSLYAIISSLFLSISIFFLDDAHDYESDRVAHPRRPVPRGLITTRQAYTISAILMLLGILSASMLFFYQFVIFLTSTIVAVAISVLNINSLLRASLSAFLIWTLFPFGAFPDLKTALFGLIVALPHVGGSITKDFIHSRGDIIQGLKPPPDWSKYLASTIFFLSGCIVWVPKMLEFVTWLYIPPITVTCVSCMVLGVKISRGHYEKVYIYGGIGMCSTLAAFLLGGF
ncbi:MAG: UbiA family prenyltransferase [Candidatus Bathyarchaeota archaeon]|nr:MAG: UbiA family prenyltransferase [Candidatus Bathyarchaeota archaeon]